jgi:hypothetical protein
MDRFLPALREPLFTDGAGKKVGRHAGHTPIATMLTGRLRPDCSHPPSPPLLVFAFVLFNKREQFFIALTRMHAVKVPALPAHLFRCDLPQTLNFREFFFWEFPLNNEKPVDMAKQGVVIMDRCDKRYAVAELCFDVFQGFSG